MIYVANKKRKLENIQKDFPNAIILDITSSSPFHYGQILSPFYPHGNIPIPGESRDLTAMCVEGIWQGLKVFENEGIDTQMFHNDTMRNIKRTVRKFGKPLGHQFGVFSNKILNYADARRYIYIPCYKWVLDNVHEVHRIIERIKEQSTTSDIVLLDYNLNPDNRDISKPLSHAELVKMYIEGHYPSKDEDFIPYTSEELKSKKQVTKAKIKRKIETAEDERKVSEQIIELLSTSERSASELIKVLSLDAKSSEIKKIIKNISGIHSRKVRRTVYYILLNESDYNPQLPFSE